MLAEIPAEVINPFGRISRPATLASIATAIQSHTLQFDPYIIEEFVLFSNGIPEAEEDAVSMASQMWLMAGQLHQISQSPDALFSIGLRQAMQIIGEHLAVTAPPGLRNAALIDYNERCSDSLRVELPNYLENDLINQFNRFSQSIGKEPITLLSSNGSMPSDQYNYQMDEEENHGTTAWEEEQIRNMQNNLDHWLQMYTTDPQLSIPGIGQIIHNYNKISPNHAIDAAIFLGAYIGYQNSGISLETALKAMRKGLSPQIMTPNERSFRINFNAQISVLGSIFAKYYGGRAMQPLAVTTMELPVLDVPDDGNQ